MNNRLVFSVGVPGVSFFVNRAINPATMEYTYSLVQTVFPQKDMKKVVITEVEYESLLKMTRNRALKQCSKFIKHRVKVPFVRKRYASQQRQRR